MRYLKVLDMYGGRWTYNINIQWKLNFISLNSIINLFQQLNMFVITTFDTQSSFFRCLLENLPRGAI